MAQNSWPFENADTTESQFSKLFNRLKSSGVAGYPADTALKVTGDSSGMNVKVAAGFAIVRGFAYENTASVTLTVGASSANPRIDLVCLKLDPTANSIVLEVVAGTPAVTPSAPTLTQTETGIYELEIGRVTVPALATVIAAGDVSDTRPCLGDAVGVWTSTQRPAGHVGQLGWSTSNQVLEVFDGSNWIEAAPKNIDAATITSGTLDSAVLGTLPIDNLSAVGSSLNPGDLLVVDPSYAIIGTPASSAVYTGKVNNPTVGTTLTTTGPSVTTDGGNQVYLIMVSCAISSAAADRTITLYLQRGTSTTIETFDQFIPNGKTGHITAVYPFVASGTNYTFRANFKSSSGVTTNIDSYLSVIGIY